MELVYNEKGFSREVIKYLAMAAMFLNHMADVLMTEKTWLGEFFLNIGYFTAVTICYYLVGGFLHAVKKKICLEDFYLCNEFRASLLRVI